VARANGAAGTGFAAVRQASLGHIHAIAKAWLPGGKLAGREYMALNPKRPDTTIGSFKINVDTGLWSDFAEAGVKGGDVIGLAEYLFDENSGNATARVARFIGSNGTTAPPKAKTRAKLNTTVWTGPDPQLVTFTMQRLPPPVAVWFYRNVDGIIAAVVRYNMPDGGKEFRPWVCVAASNQFGGSGLVWKSKAPEDARPLYNLDKLTAGCKVIVCEGEKSADAATKLGYVGVTSMNGAKSPGKSDWSSLAGHDVVIWPDHDKAGDSYAVEVVDLLAEFGVVPRIVEIPDSWPKGWDLADPLPPGVTLSDIHEMLGAAEEVKVVGTSHHELTVGFVEQHRGELRSIPRLGMWVTYDPTYGWQEDETLRVFDLARIFANGVAANTGKREAKIVRSAATRAAIVSMALSDQAVATTTGVWDADLSSLSTPGEIINMGKDKLQIRQRSPADLTRKCTAVKASDRENCPKWFKFLDRVIPEKAMQKYLQRACGYTLTGDISEHTLFFLYGTGRNGKGVFLNTIRGILDGYARIAPMAAFMASRNERHPQELASLVGARMVVAQEPGEGGHWNEELIKTLTGGNEVTAHYMRQNDFTYMPQFKLWIAGNYKPSLKSVDPAIRTRLPLIPFTVFIPPEERNPHLEEELKAEWPGILRWMLNGYLEWQRIRLAPPASVVDATEEYLRNEDTFSLWLSDMCVVAGEVEEGAKKPLPKDAFTLSSLLFISWKAWADANGHYVGNGNTFGKKFEGFKQGKQGGHRGVFGIRLKTSRG
jgi:putative DNA primase/helicase